MRIRLRLTLIFIALMVLAIMVTISFSILQIRNHLYLVEREQLQATANRLLPSLPIDTAEARKILMAATPPQWHFVYVRATDTLSSVGRRQQSFWALLQPDAPTADTLLVGGATLGNNTLVLYTSKHVIMEELMPIRWIIYTGMFISTALVAVIAIAFAHWLTRPVLRLRQTAQNIAAGKLEALADGSTRADELGELAQAINQMAGTLRRDNEQLKAANQRQRQLYADITHELKNPLHTLLASLEMVAMPQTGNEQKAQYAQVALATGQRLNRLFNDLMTLQRADADPAFVHRRPTDAAALLQRIVNLYTPQCQAKGVLFTIAAAPATVIADADKLEQVLDNLLSNALKATASGGTIALDGVAHPDGYEIAVTDTGVGFAPEHLPRLTDRFYRTDEARSRDKGGTGLGLAVVKSILEAHGAALTITSELGKGARFAFRLPLV